jgi:hemerythrin-like domain-containing protein
MRPTETLMHEHQIILIALGAAEREVASIGATGQVHTDRIEKMLDLFPNFADRCHHAKEEKLLFVRMGERGVPVQGGPVAVMLHEHEMGRAFLRAAAEALPQARAGDAGAIVALRDALGGYTRLLKAHIAKEDTILFPMADRLFGPEDQSELEEAFERVEAEEIGQGVHDRYHQMAHDLAEQA